MSILTTPQKKTENEISKDILRGGVLPQQKSTESLNCLSPPPEKIYNENPEDIENTLQPPHKKLEDDTPEFTRQGGVLPQQKNPESFDCLPPPPEKVCNENPENIINILLPPTKKIEVDNPEEKLRGGVFPQQKSTAPEKINTLPKSPHPEKVYKENPDIGDRGDQIENPKRERKYFPGGRKWR